ncbi:GNAT family N-acetyltransferase [Aurantivibrio infirmus]
MKDLPLKAAIRKTCIIRHAQRKDCAVLVDLMRELAEFEGYAQHFKVTESVLHEKLIDQRIFSVLVAEQEHQLIGMLVYYHLPFTYDLNPWTYIKELYVIEDFRSQNVGFKLVKQLACECEIKGSNKIRWDVLSSNLKAQQFYYSLGARHEREWMLFSLSGENIRQIAACA